MNFRLISRFAANLVLALIFFATALQPIAYAAPAPQTESTSGTGQAYTVQPGDSLYKISVATLGSGSLWPQIQEATNAKAATDDSFSTIDQPSLIRSGQKIWIPTVSDNEMADNEMADNEMADNEMATQSLAEAGEQLEVAIAHYGFLKDSLEADDLAMAETHAEHVINILDGEDGRYFGDVNRDGKTQNPGDSVGVRGHLEQADKDAEGTGDGPSLVIEAIETAGKLQAVDSASEAMAVADDLGALLDQVTSLIDDQLLDDGMVETATVDEEMADGESGDGAAAAGLAILFDEADGLFAAAAGQTKLAMDHSAFLADEIDTGKLDAAKNHAEHVVNILDGEEGLFFGDNNRDGQTQNPGDGVGVRGYLEQALEQLAASESEADEGEHEVLVDLVNQGLTLVEGASEHAFELLATEAISDALPLSGALTSSLTEVEETIKAMSGLAPSMTADDDAEMQNEDVEDDSMDSGEDSAGSTEDGTSLITALLAEQEWQDALAGAKAQAAMAANHYGFLQDSLAGDDLAMALAHAEHVINILDGEDGLLFGDSNRDGKTQNPGDGIGVRAHLAGAGEPLLELLASAASEATVSNDVQTLLAAIEQGQQATSQSANGVIQLFTADDVGAAGPMADALGLHLADLQASITAAMGAAAKLQ